MSAAVPEPDRGQAGKSETGRACPFCRFPLKERDDVVSCGVCHAPHHDDCWEENQGCAVVGCPGGATAAPAIPPIDVKQRARIEMEDDPVRPAPREPHPRADAGRAPESAGNAGSPGSSGRGDRILVAAFAVVVVLALVGIFLVVQVFGGDGSDDEGDKAAHFPNVSHRTMASDIEVLLTRWYDYVRGGDFDYAWEDLSHRKQQAVLNHGGKASWKASLQDVKYRYKPGNSSIKVHLVKPSYPDEGVMSIRVSGLSFEGCGKPTGGIAWAKYDTVNQRWKYEPGPELTEQRRNDWAGSSDLLTSKVKC